MSKRNSPKKVDLVHYVNGERVVIGKAVVEISGDILDITAKLTHDDGSGVFEVVTDQLKHLSIDWEPRR